MRVIVVGGYGTFGSIASRELASRGLPVVVAGRNASKARRLADELACGAVGLDVTDPEACAAVVQAGDIVVICAGPFQALGDTLLRVCLAAGAHVVDIADDRGWCRAVAALPWHARDLSAVYGCSSLPGISGALATVAGERVAGRADRARVTLFIGHRNPKGKAAITSMLHGLGWPMVGGGRGGHHGVVVTLPAPFGRRRVVDFDSPDRDELPVRLGLESVEVKVGFESRVAMGALALLARLKLPLGARSARWLACAAGALPATGHSGGVVLCELFDGERKLGAASVGSSRDGQRLAVLPAVFAAEALAAGRIAPGAQSAWVALGAQDLLERLEAEGYTLSVEAH